MSDLEVKSNWCRCHPETCGCDPWAVYSGDDKLITFYHKKDAENHASLKNESITMAEHERLMEKQRDACIGAVVDARVLPVDMPDEHRIILFKAIKNATIGETCEHGNGLNDYCEPCGRIHGGGE